jgi:hypothetical protein
VKAIETLLLWIGVSFTADLYMMSAKIQGMLWSVADIVLVFVFLKIADQVRLRTRGGKIRWRYFFLWGSAALTPLLVFTRNMDQFLLLESVICGIQFCILILTVIMERKGAINVFKDIERGDRA